MFEAMVSSIWNQQNQCSKSVKMPGHVSRKISFGIGGSTRGSSSRWIWHTRRSLWLCLVWGKFSLILKFKKPPHEQLPKIFVAFSRDLAPKGYLPEQLVGPGSVPLELVYCKPVTIHNWNSWNSWILHNKNLGAFALAKFEHPIKFDLWYTHLCDFRQTQSQTHQAQWAELSRCPPSVGEWECTCISMCWWESEGLGCECTCSSQPSAQLWRALKRGKHYSSPFFSLWDDNQGGSYVCLPNPVTVACVYHQPQASCLGASWILQVWLEELQLAKKVEWSY